MEGGIIPLPIFIYKKLKKGKVMIAVNGKRIMLSDLSDKYAKEINDGIAFIKRNYRFPLYFKYPERLKIENTENPNKPIWPGGRFIKYKETVSNRESGTEEWTYFTSSRITDKGNEELTPDGFVFNGRLAVDELNADLAFFLLYKSIACENSLNNDVIKMNSKKHFELENKRKDADMQLKRDAKRIEVEYIIKSENSILKEERLRELAVKHGLINAKDQVPNNDGVLEYIMSESEVRVQLWTLIQLKAKTEFGIYHSFIYDVKQTPETGKRRTDFIQALIDAEIISLRNQGVIKIWHLTEKKEGEKRGMDICKCKTASDTTERCMNDLSNEMDQNQPLLDLLKDKLDVKKTVVIN